jgi:Ca2+-transporting ATPase
VEGVAILIAVLIVVMVGSVNDWQKERQFKKLNEKKDDRMINCIRGGVRMSINTKVSCGPRLGSFDGGNALISFS